MNEEPIPDTLSGKTVLPDSRLRNPKGLVQSFVGYEVPIYCANCGVQGGTCPEENMTFAFYLCTPCFQTYGELTNTMVIPDEVFWREVEVAQREKYGRSLTSEETVASLADSESLESRLARSRADMTPKAST